MFEISNTTIGSTQTPANLQVQGFNRFNEFAAPAILSIGGDQTDSLTVNGNADIDGEWLFDVASLSDSDLLTVSGNIDLGADSIFTINGPTAGASPSNPIIIAQYGTRTGEFNPNSITGLGPGQSIDYAFNGNQIAIVPEPSRILPVLLGFLPLLVLRRRTRLTR